MPIIAMQQHVVCDTIRHVFGHTERICTCNVQVFMICLTLRDNGGKKSLNLFAIVVMAQGMHLYTKMGIAYRMQ